MKQYMFALAVLLLIATVGASVAHAQFYKKAPYTDCAVQRCDAGQAATYLLWSRESDRNLCRNQNGPILGVDGARSFCNNILKGNAPAPIDDLGVVNGLKQFFSTQTTALPLVPSSSSLLAFGSVQRQNSFGSLFAERPQTSGHPGALDLSVGYQHTRFVRVDGEPLSEIHTDENGTADHRDLTSCRTDGTNCPSQRWLTDLSMQMETYTLGASIGVLRDVDISVTVPRVHVWLAGRVSLRQQFGPSNPDGTEIRGIPGGGESWGIGDTIARAKWELPERFWTPSAYKRTTSSSETEASIAETSEPAKLRLALIGQHRFPTGDEEQFMGVGRHETTLMVVGTFNAAPLATSRLDMWTKGVGAHFNIGHTWSGDGIRIGNIGPRVSNQYTADFDINPSSAWTYTFGGDAPAYLSSRNWGTVSLSLDYVGQTVKRSAEFYYQDFVGVVNHTLESQPFLRERSNVTLGFLTLGARVRVARPLLFTTQILLPKTENGLRAQRSWMVGLEFVH